jgi:predicted permease
MLTDLRFALRQFAKSPLFTAAVVLVLGLGVGATTAVFTLVDAYLLKPLPFPEPDRLVTVWQTRPPERELDAVSPADFLDLKEQARSFSHLAIFGAGGFTLGGGPGAGGREAPAEVVSGSRVSADFFPLFGARAALGRLFSPEEDRPGGEQVVVLGDALWRERFGADPGVIGRAVTLDGKPYEVVGVLPPSFRLPAHLTTSEPPGLWLPAALARENAAPRGAHSTSLGHVVGRLAPGASRAAADAELAAVAGRLAEGNPESNANETFALVGLHEYLARDVRPTLALLFAATLLLLTIASANVALLLLARAATRQGEAAVRAALGASRGRLVRQFLVESALLALAAGLVGFAFAAAGSGLVAAGLREAARAPHEARPDARVFAFALLCASAAGLGVGLWPAWRASQARLYGLLKEGAARATAGGGGRRLQAGLLVAEVATAAVLLAGSAAVARGFYRTLREPLGFATEGALTFTVRLPAARYPDADAVQGFQRGALERLGALPGVSAVGAADYLPLTGVVADGSFELEGAPPPAPGAEPSTMVQRVEDQYFRALGVPVLRGRGFTEADGPGAAPVAVVSESFAGRYVPGGDALGRRVRVGRAGRWHEIVGVVGDVRYTPWARAAAAVFYAPGRQRTAVGRVTSLSFVVRTSGEPRALANAARDAVARVDAGVPVADVKTFDERASESVADRKFTLTLVSAFAASALVLTALGLFGLVSYQTRRRARELAIRMALGAGAADVTGLVVRDTARLLLAGLALGLPAAFASGKLLAAGLEGVPPADALSLAASAFVLGAVALVAVLAPARRAARTPPALVLRDD